MTLSKFNIRTDLFKDADFLLWPLNVLLNGFTLIIKNTLLRKLCLLLIGLSFTGKAVAPDTKFLIIYEAPAIRPYSALMNAVGTVETMSNTLAFNELENAAGIFQIRQVRVDDYNQRTGKKYTLLDMFDYEVSEKVFLYFAELTGPYNFEKIAKAWNGSGPRTELYWERIKTLLGR